MIYGIIVAPFWSAFTEAYTQEDYKWMKRTYSKLSKIWLITIPLISVMLILSNYVYNIWIGNNISIPFKLSLFVSIYILILSRAHLYMSLINGSGKISLQTIIYVFFSFISTINGLLYQTNGDCWSSCDSYHGILISSSHGSSPN